MVVLLCLCLINCYCDYLIDDKSLLLFGFLIVKCSSSAGNGVNFWSVFVGLSGLIEIVPAVFFLVFYLMIIDFILVSS